MIDPHFLDHLAPAPGRLETLERLAAGVEYADARRFEHLVPGEDVEVGSHRGQVQGQVRGALGAVQQDEGARFPPAPDDLGHGIDGAQHVRHVGEGHHASPRRQEPRESLHVEESLSDHRHRLQRCAAVAARHLPRDQVRVVLHLTHEDLVAWAERPSHGLGDEVDGLRRPAGEDDLFPRGRPHEGAYRVSRPFVELGRFLAQGVDGPVDVPVASLVVARHSLDDLARLLARGRGVEVDERNAVDQPAQNGEIRAAALAGGAHRATSRPSSAP